MGPGLLSQETGGTVKLSITSLNATSDLKNNVSCHERATG